MKIHFAESEYWTGLPAGFKERYALEIKKAYKEVMKLLPFGAKHLNFYIHPRTYGLIEETGDNARTSNNEFIELAFDPTRNQKGLEVIISGVRPAVFHEMNHAARFNIPIFHLTFLDNCVLEGLATVFARDYSSEDAGWAKYPKNVTEWLREIIDKNDMFYWQHYMFKHPDGRRWMGYKVGTYIIDKAMKNSGETVIELTRVECSEILSLAKIKI